MTVFVLIATCPVCKERLVLVFDDHPSTKDDAAARSDVHSRTCIAQDAAVVEVLARSVATNQ